MVTTEEFIAKSKSIWKDKYLYHNTVYKNSYTKVIITCKIHGDFTQFPNNHYRYKCKKCTVMSEYNINKNNIAKQTFVEKANSIHKNKYSYIKTEYIKASQKVIIICPIHGEFECSPNNHLRGRCCPPCSRLLSNMSNLVKESEFMKKIKDIGYDNIYDYSKVEWKGSDTKITVICKKHKEFKILPYQHIKGRGCNKCCNQYSKTSIDWLKFKSIQDKTYIQHALNEGEYVIPNTRYKADGYSESTNTIYEYLGDFWHGNPRLYNTDEINRKTNCTFGLLYDKTIEKKDIILSLGYNYLCIWEHDWNNFIKIIKRIQKKFKERKNNLN